MFQTKVKSTFKILDFDIECRPLSWLGQDYVTKEVTAIAACFVGSREVNCWLLGVNDSQEMLESFLKMYDEAGMVTGHYIRGFDLPTINGALTEFGYEPLSSKLTQDTYLDLIKRQGLSNSQQNLSATLGVESAKVGMSMKDWREANRLTPDGIEKTKDRVVGDVIQHMEMREELLKRKMLKSPVMWNSVKHPLETE